MDGSHYADQCIVCMVYKHSPNEQSSWLHTMWTWLYRVRHVTISCVALSNSRVISIFVAYLLVGIFSTILPKEYYLCTHILRLKSSFQFPCLKLLLMPSHISYSLVDIGLPSPRRLEFYHGYRISCYLDGCWGRPEPPRSYGRPADS